MPLHAGAANEGERIVTIRAKIDEVIAALARNDMRNGPLLIALQWLALNRARLRELLALPGVVAAGECGLDYYRNYSPYESQRRAFAQQLQLAAELGKPVFLHQRDAHRDFIAALREHGAGLRGVAHCFTGGAEELDSYLELGLHIGITGWICDERRGQHLHDLVARIPRGRLLLETDAPYLLPRDLQPKPALRRNEPLHLPHIAATVARLRDETYEDCVAHTTAAARALFDLPVPAGSYPHEVARNAPA